jgi:hypothetical protein
MVFLDLHHWSFVELKKPATDCPNIPYFLAGKIMTIKSLTFKPYLIPRARFSPNIHSAMPQTPRQTRTPSPVRGPRECPGAPKRARSVRPTPVSATVYRSLFNEFEALDAAAARAACETEA